MLFKAIHLCPHLSSLGVDLCTESQVVLAGKNVLKHVSISWSWPKNVTRAESIVHLLGQLDQNAKTLFSSARQFAENSALEKFSILPFGVQSAYFGRHLDSRAARKYCVSLKEKIGCQSVFFFNDITLIVFKEAEISYFLKFAMRLSGEEYDEVLELERIVESIGPVLDTNADFDKDF